MSKNTSIIGKQYGNNSSAFRAIRNYCRHNNWAHPENYFTNKVDNGCVEIDYIGEGHAVKKN